MKGIEHLFFNSRWAVALPVLSAMGNIVQRHSAGVKLSTAEIEAIVGERGNASGPDFSVEDGVAYIPVYGIISKRMNMINNISLGGGASIEEVEKSFQAALSDDSVKRIVLDIDSPGGSMDGVLELSDLIYASRKKKPIVAFANGQMCSAAYLLGSAADKVYASRGAFVGSIGIYAVVHDHTHANWQVGINSEVIKSGKNKASGHPDKPFTQNDREVIQKEVNAFYELFVETVARNRGMSVENVLNIATGDIFIAKEAVENGLVDGIKLPSNFFNSSAADQTKKARVLPGAVSTSVPAPAKVPVRPVISVQTSALPGAAVLPAAEKHREEFQTMPKVLSIEEQCKKDWDSNPDIRNEFKTLAVYVGFKRAEAAGKCKIISGTMIRGASKRKPA